MVTLSSYNGFLFIHSLSTAFSAISVIVNVVTIIRYIVKPNSRQPRMILLAIHCNFVFSFVAFIHSAYMVLLLDDKIRRRSDLIFWTGALSYSMNSSIEICNLFVALDRVFVMCKPVRYCQSYQYRLHLVAVAFIFLPIVTFTTIFALDRDSNPSVVMAFVDFFKKGVIYILYWFDVILSIANVVATVVFIKEFKVFLAHVRATKSLVVIGNQKVNRMVLYQIIVEFIVLIIPIMATSTANMMQDVSWPRKYGPYPLTCFTLYTLICSFLFFFVNKH
ncbi:hypothetical protein L596_029446 [Steinernema carpocapsae]|uniref:G-protein coupled receptors family 1 profile domain-containing protein n=1 Tax=Steinernema carpocapsae TaxID=34508 RepID=A0A4U5LUN8_STECR|nr:hypothetical protein L596_029446 [Steinernema carpocapsae]